MSWGDVTGELQKLRKPDEEDKRPWYQKSWPYMKKNQRIKIIPAYMYSLISPQQNALMKIVTGWHRRMAKLTSYDFKSKLIVLGEVTIEDEPYEYSIGTKVKLIELKDDEGKTVELNVDNDKIKTGNYRLIHIGLYPMNWSNIKDFEEALVHEFLHVIHPDSELTIEMTQETIKKYGSLAD